MEYNSPGICGVPAADRNGKRPEPKAGAQTIFGVLLVESLLGSGELPRASALERCEATIGGTCRLGGEIARAEPSKYAPETGAPRLPPRSLADRMAGMGCDCTGEASRTADGGACSDARHVRIGEDDRIGEASRTDGSGGCSDAWGG